MSGQGPSPGPNASMMNMMQGLGPSAGQAQPQAQGQVHRHANMAKPFSNFSAGQGPQRHRPGPGSDGSSSYDDDDSSEGDQKSQGGQEDYDDQESGSERSYGSSGDARSSIVHRSGHESQRRSEEDDIKEKRELLYQFDRLQRKGVRLPHAFSMASSIEDMRAELERLKTDKEVDASVRFQRRMLMACVTGIEFMNSKFDPFDVKLEGWSDSINENIDDYDDVFEELFMKYRGKAKMAPELKLMFMVGGSAVMFHLSNSLLKNMMPGMDQVFRQNPELASQLGKAAMSTMMGGGGGAQPSRAAAAPAPASGGGPFGMLGSLFGSLFGGGPSASAGAGAPGPARSAPAGARPAPPGTPPPGMARQMRGPVAVDDILSELQQNAFPSGPGANRLSAAASSRIEVLSNASDSDISELLQDAGVMQVAGTAAKRMSR